MDPNWQQYHDPAGASSRRHNGNAQMSPPSAGQHQPPAGYAYDQYHPAAAIPAAVAAAPAVHHGNPAVSPMAAGQPRDGNGDVAMRDAIDSHAGIKYAMRPHHQQHMSGGRAAALHSPHDQPSSAAQRYSPMETLSPTSPYGAAKQSQFSGPPSQTQSPAGASEYPQSPYYAGRPQNAQLPPMSPYGPSGTDGYPSATVAHLDGTFNTKSPQRPNAPTVKRVPEFRKLRAVSDLQPKNNRQPAFRRANPEGGFISVCFSPPLTSMDDGHTKSTHSLFKLLQPIYRLPIESATRASSTKHHGTPAES